MFVSYIITKKMLESYINDGMTVSKIANSIGCSYTNVRFHLKKFGIRTIWQGGGRKRIKSPYDTNYCENCGNEISKQRRYCDTRCQKDKQYKDYILKWKNGEENGLLKSQYGVSGNIRKYLWEKYNGKCSKCGWNTPNPITGKPFLEIEHIDGNSSNNCEENLDLICPNCHSITPTFRALNKGRGRRKHGKIIMG